MLKGRQQHCWVPLRAKDDVHAYQGELSWVGSVGDQGLWLRCVVRFVGGDSCVDRYEFLQFVGLEIGCVDPSHFEFDDQAFDIDEAGRCAQQLRHLIDTGWKFYDAGVRLLAQLCIYIVDPHSVENEAVAASATLLRHQHAQRLRLTHLIIDEPAVLVGEITLSIDRKEFSPWNDLFVFCIKKYIFRIQPPGCSGRRAEHLSPNDSRSELRRYFAPLESLSR